MMPMCQNCGHEAHDGPLWKEFTDGDGLPIMIEVCKNFVAQLDKGQQMCYNTVNAKEN